MRPFELRYRDNRFGDTEGCVVEYLYSRENNGEKRIGFRLVPLRPLWFLFYLMVPAVLITTMQFSAPVANNDA